MSTSQLFHSSLRSPGETRVLREAWINGIRQGVQDGLFALGEKAGGKLVPRYFKELPLEVTLDNDEVIIQPNLIRESIYVRRHFTGLSNGQQGGLNFSAVPIQPAIH